MKIGNIDIFSGYVLVSDPCYIPDTIDNNVGVHRIQMDRGTYPVFIDFSDEGSWGTRVSEILLGKETKQIEDIGYAYVDSGQMSFMDAALVPSFKDDNQTDDKWEPENHKGEFTYQGVCDATLGMSGGCIDNKIAASSSGYGDGAYPVEVYKENGEVVGIKVIFIGDEEEEY